MINNKIISILILLVLGYIIYTLANPFKIKNKGEVMNTESQDNNQEISIPDEDVNQPDLFEEPENVVQQSDPITNNFAGYEPLGNGGADLAQAFNPPVPEGTDTNAIDFNKNNQDKYDSTEYLPVDVNNDWFETDFTSAKYNINDESLIETKKFIHGVNTVGQSLKNASYDIRGTIANPKFTVSPWNNSTYEADHNLKPLC